MKAVELTKNEREVLEAIVANAKKVVFQPLRAKMSL